MEGSQSSGAGLVDDGAGGALFGGHAVAAEDWLGGLVVRVGGASSLEVHGVWWRWKGGLWGVFGGNVEGGPAKRKMGRGMLVDTEEEGLGG